MLASAGDSTYAGRTVVGIRLQGSWTEIAGCTSVITDMKERDMSWLLALVMTGALLSPAVAQQSVTIQDFYGSWQGTELTTEGGVDLPNVAPGDLDIGIEPSGDGFRLRWTGAERAGEGRLALRQLEAGFMPTERPGVFEFDADERSLLDRLFAAPETGNPLEGDTLLWARLEQDTLTVYSLGINAQGGFDLDRYAWRLGKDGMTVHYSRRTESEGEIMLQGQLTAVRG